MIKKNTKIVFKNGEDERPFDMVGGIPLSKGEVITVHEGNAEKIYEVSDKIVDCYINGDDQTVDITYVIELRK